MSEVVYCTCARCGGDLFARNPDGSLERHPAHAHPERRGKGFVDFPRCYHGACFLAEYDERRAAELAA